jgi:hypothetical protein
VQPGSEVQIVTCPDSMPEAARTSSTSSVTSATPKGPLVTNVRVSVWFLTAANGRLPARRVANQRYQRNSVGKLWTSRGATRLFRAHASTLVRGVDTPSWVPYLANRPKQLNGRQLAEAGSKVKAARKWAKALRSGGPRTVAKQPKDERGPGTRFASDPIHAPVGPAARCERSSTGSVLRAPDRFAETVSGAREGLRGPVRRPPGRPRTWSREAVVAGRLLGTFDLGRPGRRALVPITGSPATERSGRSGLFLVTGSPAFSRLGHFSSPPAGRSYHASNQFLLSHLPP